MRVELKLLTALGILLLGLVSTRHADASPTARLVYARSAAADACPDEHVLRTAVAARIGYDPFFPWAKQTVVVLVSRESDGYAARVEVVDDANSSHGTRQLRGGDMPCEGLLDAVALAVTIALEAPESPSAPPEHARPEEPVRTAIPPPDASGRRPDVPLAPAPAAPDEAAPTSSKAARSRAFVALQAVGSVGAAPEVSAGAELSAGLRRGAWSVAVGVRADAPGSTGGQPDGGQVVVTLVAGTVAPCVYLGPFFGCAVAMVGQLRATGVDVSGGREVSALLIAAGPRVGAELPLGAGFALRIDAEALGNLQRATAELDGQSVWHASPVIGSLAGGVVVHFP